MRKCHKTHAALSSPPEAHGSATDIKLFSPDAVYSHQGNFLHFKSSNIYCTLFIMTSQKILPASSAFISLELLTLKTDLPHHRQPTPFLTFTCTNANIIKLVTCQYFILKNAYLLEINWIFLSFLCQFSVQSTKYCRRQNKKKKKKKSMGTDRKLPHRMWIAPSEQPESLLR